MKKVLSVLMVAVVFLALVPMSIEASALNATGQCGDNVYWDYDSLTKELVISGTGDMWDDGESWGVDSEYEYESPFIDTDIETIIVDNGVTKIGDGVFGNCEKLKNVILGDNVTIVGNGAFYCCTNLEKVVLGECETEIWGSAFLDCTSLVSVENFDNVTSVSSAAFNNCSSLLNVNFSDALIRIGWCGFYGCSSLTKIEIPDSVALIGDRAFSHCTNLESIIVSEENENFSNDEYGVLFNKDKTKVIQYPAAKEEKEYTIPDSVVYIGDSAFIGNSNLVNIYIPETVTVISFAAFSDCEGLADVYYSGTQEQWLGITIIDYNEPLLNATIHCSDGDIVPIPEEETTKPEESTTEGKITDGDITPTETTTEIPSVTDGSVVPTEPIGTPTTDNKEEITTKQEEATTKEATTLTTTVPTTVAPDTAPTTEKKEEPVVKAKKPAKVKIKKPKSTKKKQIVVTWNKAKNANGYQLAYSTSKKFTKKATKTKLIKKAKTTKTTLKKLKSGKKYFIRIRAYKTVNNKKVYGAYSKIMTVKVK